MKNKIVACGKMIMDYRYSHESFGEKFYSNIIEIKRTSGVPDKLSVIVSEVLLSNIEERNVLIYGTLRTYNINSEQKQKVKLYIFADELVYTNKEDYSEVELNGVICKNPVYRKTPKGREITELLIAVNRPYGKSDYLPCIVWGRDARRVSSYIIGTTVELSGRLQSREYLKDGQKRSTIEVSVSKIQTVED